MAEPFGASWTGVPSPFLRLEKGRNDRYRNRWHQNLGRPDARPDAPGSVLLLDLTWDSTSADTTMFRPPQHLPPQWHGGWPRLRSAFRRRKELALSAVGGVWRTTVSSCLPTTDQRPFPFREETFRTSASTIACQALYFLVSITPTLGIFCRTSASPEFLSNLLLWK